MTPQEYRDWYGYDRADKELFEPVKDCDSAATTVTDSNETTVATVKGR